MTMIKIKLSVSLKHMKSQIKFPYTIKKPKKKKDQHVNRYLDDLEKVVAKSS